MLDFVSFCCSTFALWCQICMFCVLLEFWYSFSSSWGKMDSYEHGLAGKQQMRSIRFVCVLGGGELDFGMNLK